MDLQAVAETGEVQLRKLRAKLTTARESGDINGVIYYERAIADAEAGIATAARLSTDFAAVFGAPQEKGL